MTAAAGSHTYPLLHPSVYCSSTTSVLFEPEITFKLRVSRVFLDHSSGTYTAPSLFDPAREASRAQSDCFFGKRLFYSTQISSNSRLWWALDCIFTSLFPLLTPHACQKVLACQEKVSLRTLEKIRCAQQWAPYYT